MNKRMVKSVSIGTIVLLLGAGSAFAEGRGNAYGKEKARPGASAGNWAEKKHGNNGNGRGCERKPESTRRELNRNHNGQGGRDNKLEEKKKEKKVTTIIVKPATVVAEKKPKPTGNGTVIGSVKPGKVVRPVSRPVEHHVPSPKPVVKVIERSSATVSEKDLLAAGIGGMLVGGLFATLMAASN